MWNVFAMPDVVSRSLEVSLVFQCFELFRRCGCRQSVVSSGSKHTGARVVTVTPSYTLTVGPEVRRAVVVAVVTCAATHSSRASAVSQSHLYAFLPRFLAHLAQISRVSSLASLPLHVRSQAASS